MDDSLASMNDLLRIITLQDEEEEEEASDSSSSEVVTIKTGEPSEDFHYVQLLSEEHPLHEKYGLKYVCCRPYTTTLKCGVDVTVPVGFVCDGCTGGWDKLGETEWLVHDWLYFTEGRVMGYYDYSVQVSREEADSIFLQCPQYHRWLLVRMFGALHWGKRKIDPKKRVQPELVQ